MTVTELARAAPLTGGEGELRSVSIAVGVLDCFATAEELGPTQVARRTGIAKSTASRMLSALAGGGLLERTAAGRYRLSLRLFHYGRLAIDRLPLRAVARPVVAELQEALGELVQVAVPDDGHVLFVERIGGSRSGSRSGTRPPGELLRRVPGYSSSAGRIMAAFDPQLAHDTLAVARHRHTPFTITDTARLQRVLAHARRTGWVGSREEYRLGWSSLAAPVLVDSPTGRRVAGALSVVGLTDQVLGLRKEFVAASVCRAARRISAGLDSHRDRTPTTITPGEDQR